MDVDIFCTKGRPKNIKTIKSGILQLYNKVFSSLNLAGSKENKIQWPSRGGMGKRLKTAKTIFIYTIRENKLTANSEDKRPADNLAKIEKRTARIILDKGPAKATLAGPHFLSERFKGLYGTGFA